MVGYRQLPLWSHSNAQIGEDVVAFEVQTLNDELKLEPQDESAKIYIFWTTWCGPCHLQLAQFDKAVEFGQIDAKNIIAVSLDKSVDLVQAFAEEKKYNFKVVRATSKSSWVDLNIQATPSIAFVKNKKIANFFTGLSPLSVFKAKSFLKN